MPKVEICLANLFVRQQIMSRYLKSVYYLTACKLSIPEKHGKHKKVSLKPRSDERARGDLPRKSLCAAKDKVTIPDMLLIFPHMK